MTRPESEQLSQKFPIKTLKEDFVEKKVQFPLEGKKTLSALPDIYSVEAVSAFDNELPQIFEATSDQSLADESSAEEAEYLNNSRILLEAKEYGLAQNLLRRVLAKNSRHLVAIKWMGDALRGEGQLEDASRCYSELLRIEETTDNHIRLADTLYECDQREEALNHYYLALEGLRGEEPILFNIYKNIGNILIRDGDFEGAEENYNRAYTLRADSDVLMVNYGTLEIQRGNWQKSVERFRQAVELNPLSDKAWVGLSLVHRQFGDVELSWGNLERALDINSENETALNLAIDWALKDGRSSQIINLLEDYMQHRDQDVAKSLILAKLLYSSGRYQSAAIELERTLALAPTSSEAMTLKKLLDEELNKQWERFG